jgi:hypothetical protein
MKMDFFQSRWVAINLSCLQRLCQSIKLSQEDQKKLKAISKDYALAFPKKLKVALDRENNYGNDLALITNHLRKLSL